MGNTVTWHDPDTVQATQEQSTPGVTYVISPTTQKAIDPTSVNIANANPNGQATMANSSPVVLASDEIVPINLTRVLGSPLSATNPLIDQEQIRALIANGNVFACSTGKLTSPASGTVGASIFMSVAANKNLFILSAVALSSGSSQNWQANAETVDPALGSSLTAVNLKGGGGASVASASYTNTNATAAGTLFKTLTISGNTSFETFPYPFGYFVPAGTAGGVTIYFTPSSSVTWGVDFIWVEY